MGHYKGCSGPSGSACARAREIEQELARRDPGGHSGGIYNPRRVAGSRKWSLHACGRAIDWFPTNRGAGAVLAAWLAGPYGPEDIQAVLWDAWSWRRRLWQNWRRITRGNKHTDHLH